MSNDKQYQENADSHDNASDGYDMIVEPFFPSAQTSFEVHHCSYYISDQIFLIKVFKLYIHVLIIVMLFKFFLGLSIS